MEPMSRTPSGEILDVPKQWFAREMEGMCVKPVFFDDYSTVGACTFFQGTELKDGGFL